MNIDDMRNTVICGDCLEIMKQMPDKCVDLVLTDPPYGIGIANNPFRQKFEKAGWDNKIPNNEYLFEIQRVSRNQIIWGGNYFPALWSNGCRGFLYWNKMNHHNNRCDGELAWTSFDMCARQFDYMWDGNRYGFFGNIRGVGQPSIRVHPTQKPIELMVWCIVEADNQSENNNFVVLDPFLGSGTTAVACYRTRRDFIGVEISPEYCEIARKRIQAEKDKLALFET